MNKKLATIIMAGCMTLSSVGSALAAGLGIVDFNFLEQRHPNFNNAVKQYQTDTQKYNAEYTEKSKGLTNQEKQTMANEYNAKLNQRRIALFKPIDQDVLNAINKVRIQKGLDYIAAKGYVLSGTVQADITKEVAREVEKAK